MIEKSKPKPKSYLVAGCGDDSKNNTSERERERDEKNEITSGCDEVGLEVQWLVVWRTKIQRYGR